MKRCPECRRDYYDDTLRFCLDDGNALLEGPGSFDDPAATEILHSAEAVTLADTNITAKTAIYETMPQTNRSARRTERPLAAFQWFAETERFAGIMKRNYF